MENIEKENHIDITLLTLSSGTTTSLLVERPIVPPGHVIKNSLPTNDLHALDSVIMIRIHGGQTTTSMSIKKFNFKQKVVTKILLN